MKTKIKTFPLILICIGLLLIVDNYNLITHTWLKLWPIFLIIIGIVSICNSFISE